MLYLQAIYYHSLLAYKSAQLYIDIVDVIVSMFSSWSSYDHAFDRKSDACKYSMIDICEFFYMYATLRNKNKTGWGSQIIIIPHRYKSVCDYLKKRHMSGRQNFMYP
jgi:hypothetical protein